jgi:hypothetical protein
MSEEENRSTGNLLILCLEHACEVDRPNRAMAFPPALLKAWKQEQLNEFDAIGGQGWMLTSEMADDALRASEEPINIINSILNLGAHGGNAPGAGGGGGGAFGANSRGGAGGKGGDTYYDGVPISEFAFDYNLPSGEYAGAGAGAGVGVGAGGGGAGAEGENAVGGGGGGGGDRVITKVSLNELESLEGPLTVEVQVGEGGRPGQHAGEHAEDGSDSELRFVTADGKTVRSIKAKGGGRGLSGFAISPEAREATSVDIDSGLNVSALMVADALHTKNGLLYVMGGAAECWLYPELPANIFWPTTIVGSMGQVLDSLLLTFYVVVDDPDGREVFRLPFNVVKGLERPVANFTQSMVVQFNAKAAGVWVLRILSGDYEFARLPLGIQVQEASADVYGNSGFTGTK